GAGAVVFFEFFGRQRRKREKHENRTPVHIRRVFFDYRKIISEMPCQANQRSTSASEKISGNWRKSSKSRI
ncbi:MAG: hypothetical protein ACLFPD_06825, partial [Desulfosudaceae bacterium]